MTPAVVYGAQDMVERVGMPPLKPVLVELLAGQGREPTAVTGRQAGRDVQVSSASRRSGRSQCLPVAVSRILALILSSHKGGQDTATAVSKTMSGERWIRITPNTRLSDATPAEWSGIP